MMHELDIGPVAGGILSVTGAGKRQRQDHVESAVPHGITSSFQLGFAARICFHPPQRIRTENTAIPANLFLSGVCPSVAARNSQWYPHGIHGASLMSSAPQGGPSAGEV